MRLRVNVAIVMLALALNAPVASAQRTRIITLEESEKLASVSIRESGGDT